MTALALRAGMVLAAAALVVGPSAQADAPSAQARHAPAVARVHVPASLLRHPGPATGHATNEWLMMGRNCGASAGSGV